MKLREMKREKLESLYLEVVNELQWRAMSDAEDPWVIIKGQEAPKRVLIIAGAGKHTVCFCGPSGAGKTMLCAAAAKIGVVAFEYSTCPCGNFTDPRRECKCSPAAIEKWHAKADHRRIRETADMFYQVPAVPVRELFSKLDGTTLAYAIGQIANMGPRPDTERELPDSAQTMLKQAVTELGVGMGFIRKAKQVGATIAALAKDNEIHAEHIAEAIMYRPHLPY